VYIFYGVMMLVPLFGFASWLAGSAALSYVLTQISFCMLFTAWLFFGLTFAMGTILDDTCVEAGKQAHGQTNALSDLMNCGSATASSDTYKTVWEKLDTAQAATTTQGYTNVVETTYGFTVDTCPTSTTSTDFTTNSENYERNKALLLGMYTTFGVDSSTCTSMTDTSTIMLCYVPGISASSYSSTCSGSVTQACLHQGQILSAAGMTGSSYMIGCQHLNTISLALNNNICDDMVNGLINVCVGQAFIGFFYFFVLAVGCMGMNRFSKDNYNSVKVHPDETPGGPSQQVPSNAYKVDPHAANYSAEQAMAATRIQSAQRQKAARKKVDQKRHAQKHT
jgi:hypothetical protein